MMAAQQIDWEEQVEDRLAALAGLVRGFVLSPQILDMYMRLLAPLGYEQVCFALDQIMLTRDSNDPFPSFKQIASLIKPELDPETSATDIAGKIVQALHSCGDDRFGTERAKKLIGPIGWKVVESEGGWCGLGHRIKNDQLPTLKAQWKKQALAEFQKGLVASSATQIEDRSFERVKSMIRLPEMPKGEGDERG